MSGDSRKADMRKISKEGFNPLTMSKEELKRFDEDIKGLQIQFQLNYCSSCNNYDPNKGEFKETGHPNNPQDCKYHWTDITGDCWNYKGDAFKQVAMPERPTIDDVYGKRVELKEDFCEDNEFLAAVKAGLVEGFSASKELQIREFIPKGSIGTIAEGPYSSGIFDYSKEWPVQFDMFKEDVPGHDKQFTIGIPHELLKFIENRKAKRK